MNELDHNEKVGQEDATHHDSGHHDGDHEHPATVITICVNTKPVNMEVRQVTGLQIKQAAIAQGVDIKLDFVLSREIGEGGRRTEIVGNDDVVTIHKGSKFVAVPPDDNSEGPTSRVSNAVALAVEQVRETFPDATVTAIPDGEGGAYVTVDSVPLGDPYMQTETWLGARITFQYPFCDVYPFYVRQDLAHKNGAGLGDAMSAGAQFNGRTAVQVSRRSNSWNPAADTAALKFLKVLSWIRSRP